MKQTNATAEWNMGIAFVCSEASLEARAEALAAKLGTGYLPRPSEAECEKTHLVLSANGLSLAAGSLSMRGDFSAMYERLKNNKWQHEMLAKAAKQKNLPDRAVAIDATAGMGEDSMILAAAGYEVYLYEKDPVIAALLADTLVRAQADPEIAVFAAHMHAAQGDSIEVLRNLTEAPGLVYLDPMFPERKKSGLIKKKFQLLHRLERPCSDEEDLLSAAICSGANKIVIKRPAKGAYLAGHKPDYSYDGKAIRYDCIVGRPKESSN